ncbi:MAG: DUF5715 family protein [Thermoanaerobaculia bacterium]
MKLDARRALRLVPPALALALLAAPPASDAATLRGSRSSLLRQQRIARQHDYTHLRNRAHVRRFVSAGLLVPVPESRTLQIDGASYPYARPEVRVFLGRIAREYASACGEPLVVTSLTRPRSEQPRNSSPYSVHPTGMALDLRKSRKGSCRRWLESRLLTLERQGVLDATEEFRPPHYHVALYPKPYASFVTDGGIPKPSGKTLRVERGDTLWDIARRFGTTVAAIKQINGIRGSTIRPGQVLQLP